MNLLLQPVSSSVQFVVFAVITNLFSEFPPGMLRLVSASSSSISSDGPIVISDLSTIMLPGFAMPFMSQTALSVKNQERKTKSIGDFKVNKYRASQLEPK